MLKAVGSNKEGNDLLTVFPDVYTFETVFFMSMQNVESKSSSGSIYTTRSNGQLRLYYEIECKQSYCLYLRKPGSACILYLNFRASQVHNI